jgi:hypothetical protein
VSPTQKPFAFTAGTMTAANSSLVSGVLKSLKSRCAIASSAPSPEIRRAARFM